MFQKSGSRTARAFVPRSPRRGCVQTLPRVRGAVLQDFVSPCGRARGRPRSRPAGPAGHSGGGRNRSAAAVPGGAVALEPRKAGTDVAGRGRRSRGAAGRGRPAPSRGWMAAVAPGTAAVAHGNCGWRPGGAAGGGGRGAAAAPPLRCQGGGGAG